VRGAILAIGVLVGCSGPSDDVVGPFTGEVRRFVVDAITIPGDSDVANALAADLDGDGKPDNQLGAVTLVLASINDLTLDAADMIASGALASTVEIQADDFTDDPTVGIRYLGADGDPATIAGGRFVAGALRTNRTHATRVPGRAVVRLPIYTNADPLVLELEGMELELEPDGAGGYDAIVRGGIPHASAIEAAYVGLVQMIETEPERHLVFARQLDMDRDGVITREEVGESVIALLVAPDIRLFEGERYAPGPGRPDSVSVAFGVHLAPCAEGRCATALPQNPCRDRVRGGDETDVDCGGPCQPCAAGLGCALAQDCQTAGCDGGVCRAATCSDGVRDGLESDVDCGGVCGPCAAGQACAADGDCASGDCDNGIATLGRCQ
jgi:hypothetical protein